MNPKEMKKYSLLAEVACDYYERGLSQNEIAERICLSSYDNYQIQAMPRDLVPGRNAKNATNRTNLGVSL